LKTVWEGFENFRKLHINNLQNPLYIKFVYCILNLKKFAYKQKCMLQKINRFGKQIWISKFIKEIHKRLLQKLLHSIN